MVSMDFGEVWSSLAVVVLTVVASCVILVPVLWPKVLKYVWEPLRLRHIMMKQGIRGPPFRFLLGNLPELVAYTQQFPESLPLDDNNYNFTPTVSPQNTLYFPQYGKRFLYWWGAETRLVIRDPQIAKAVLTTGNANFTKSSLELYIIGKIVGTGVLSLDGEKWAIERRTLNPFFHQDVLKGMVEAMVRGAAPEIQKWEQKVTQAGGLADLDVEPDIHKISGTIIAETAFSGDVEKGKQIYQLQSEHASLLMKSFHSPTFWIPGFSRLPTTRNRKIVQLTTNIDNLLSDIIQDRRGAVRESGVTALGNDLLGRMLMAASEEMDVTTSKFNMASVFNNCKLFFFAGQDTVANLITFTLLMLARHQEWQDCARNEVLEVMGGAKESYDANSLFRLKNISMILNETLRLFVGIPALTRVASKDMQLGDLFIPKGLAIEIAIQAMHQDPEIWGADVNKFNPKRFANGASNACTHPQAFLPFALGPRICIGNNYAMMEAKIVVAMILRRFHVLPSPNYKHHPHRDLVQMPKYGMHLILKAL